MAFVVTHDRLRHDNEACGGGDALISQKYVRLPSGLWQLKTSYFGGQVNCAVETLKLPQYCCVAESSGSNWRQTLAPETLALGLVLISLQILDGILTSVGIARYGLAVEGNPFLRYLMIELGQIQALAALKFVAALIVVLLMVVADRFSWVRKAMGLVSAAYVFGAVIPWTYILFIRPVV